MPVYLFRHGEAYDIGTEGIRSDYDRMLTPKGVKMTTDMCQFLRKMEIQATEVWYSPLVRARETAEILINAFSVDKSCEKPGLAYDSNESDNVFFQLREVTPDEHLFLVGHQPDLGIWVSRLISGKPGMVALAKSGIACVDIIANHHSPRGELKWMVSPKMIRRMEKK